jgi:hypothetical protein
VKAEPRHQKELEGQQDQVHLGPGDRSVQLGLELTQLGLELLQTRLGRFEGCGDAVSLGADARVLFALVSIVVTSLRGFVCPLMSTVCDVGELAHHACSAQPHGLSGGGVD